MESPTAERSVDVLDRPAAMLEPIDVPTIDADLLDDPYAAATAEFYELLATAHWQRTGAELVALLADVDPTAGPIVDVGAGTGIGLNYLLDAVPGADVYAIEPSRAMRTALHTRLLLDPVLSGRVTVDPRPLRGALPDRASAVVAVGGPGTPRRRSIDTACGDSPPSGSPPALPSWSRCSRRTDRSSSSPCGTRRSRSAGSPTRDGSRASPPTHARCDGR